MNSEDERAFRAARRLRKQFAKLDPALLADKATFVDRAAALLGLDILNLPPDDPLLAGADGMIDRDYETIWLSNSLNPLMRRVTIAHEIGHFILHAPRFVAGDDGDEGDLIGYSQNQRDERDAHRFASEFLVPQSIIRSKFLSGLGVRHIAARIRSAQSVGPAATHRKFFR